MRTRLRLIISEDGDYTKIEVIAGPEQVLTPTSFLSQVDAGKHLTRLYEAWVRGNLA